jgi:ABC-type phosphate transport system substrate-binding protein
MFRVLLFFSMAMGFITLPASADHSPKIEIVGSITVLPIASRAAKRFEKLEGFEKVEEFKSSHRLRILVNAVGLRGWHSFCF